MVSCGGPCYLALFLLSVLGRVIMLRGYRQSHGVQQIDMQVAALFDSFPRANKHQKGLTCSLNNLGVYPNLAPLSAYRKCVSLAHAEGGLLTRMFLIITIEPHRSSSLFGISIWNSLAAQGFNAVQRQNYAALSRFPRGIQATQHMRIVLYAVRSLLASCGLRSQLGVLIEVSRLGSMNRVGSSALKSPVLHNLQYTRRLAMSRQRQV